jgi:RNA polymerase sigma-70 factor (ECF subfamily)
MSQEDSQLRELARQAGRGDRAAFQKLYLRHLEPVRAQVQRLFGPSYEGLDDVVQEVFLEAFRALPGFRGDSAFGTWLFRVAHNVAVSHLRRRAARPTNLLMLQSLRETLDEPDWDARRQVAALYAALDELSLEAREAFVLYELEGMSLRQVAELKQASINTVAAHVRRARERLRKLLSRPQRPAQRRAL